MQLTIGDKLTDGSIVVLDEDRLCYSVRSLSKGAVGVRTISKALFHEWVNALTENPQMGAKDIRNLLCGHSAIDRFEYGYYVTLQKMAEMALGIEQVIHDILRNVDSDSPYGSEVFQQISYGAPGTGKSFGTEQEIKDSGVDEKKDVFRTTFHPDSDYSTFVGAYKPTKDDPDYDTIVQVNKIVRDQEGKESVQPELKAIRKSEITYDFVPQAFIRAYVAAWKKYAAKKGAPLTNTDRVYLVIEEINRGHCAQIFGDLFQLLDRNEEGFSDYPIDADSDLAKWLKKEFSGVRGAPALPGADGDGTSGHAGRVPLPSADGDGTSGHAGRVPLPNGVAEVLEGKKLMLPPNLFIRATMNTSDQSLFPIDSAFKRRWDWEYAPIKDEGKGWYVAIGAEKYKWWSFLEKINKIVYDETLSADKQMGYFFVKLPEGRKEIDLRKFVNKVAFYLWNDVFKDREIREDALKLKDASGKPGDPIKFTDFFRPNSNVVEETVVKNLFEGLGVEKDVDKSGETTGEGASDGN